MKKNAGIMVTLAVGIGLMQLAMGNNPNQYDLEAREQEKAVKQMEKEAKASGKTRPLKGIASGVKQVAVDAPQGLISETAEETAADKPVLGTLEGARKGTGKVLDSTVKGVAKVATLGYGDVDNYKVEEPKANSDEPTKIKISF